jgi:mono/diheme cytochrome c family protein
VRQSLGIVLSFAFMALCPAFGQNTSYTPDPNWKAPASAAARVNPLAKKPEAAAGGKKIFLRECVECHGEQGWGLEKKHSADLQSPRVQSQSDGALFWKISNGNPDRGMPSFSRLPEMQRWQVVLFLRSLASDTEPARAVTQPR